MASELSRRELLRLAASMGTAALIGGPALVDAQVQSGRVFTPSVILGPFYPQIKATKERDADLTAVKGHGERATGEVIALSGRVMNLAGEPVAGATISIWQANTHGRYAHKSDKNTAPLDPNFQGFGVTTTDNEGRYVFRTIKPGAYPAPVVGMRAPHVHFEVAATHDRLITQMFFPGEPLNDQDHFLQFLKGPYRDAVIARASASGPNAFSWDIVLISG